MDSWKYDAVKGWIRPRDDKEAEADVQKKSKRMRRKKNAAKSN